MVRKKFAMLEATLDPAKSVKAPAPKHLLEMLERFPVTTAIRRVIHDALDRAMGIGLLVHARSLVSSLPILSTALHGTNLLYW